MRRWLDGHERLTFHSPIDLQAAINRSTAERNAAPKPFLWTADTPPHHRRRQAIS